MSHHHHQQQRLQKFIQITCLMGPPFTGKHKLYQTRYETLGFDLLTLDNVETIRSKLFSIIHHNNNMINHHHSSRSNNNHNTYQKYKLCVMCHDKLHLSQVLTRSLHLTPAQQEQYIAFFHVFLHGKCGITQLLWSSEYEWSERMIDSQQQSSLSSLLVMHQDDDDDMSDLNIDQNENRVNSMSSDQNLVQSSLVHRLRYLYRHLQEFGSGGSRSRSRRNINIVLDENASESEEHLYQSLFINRDRREFCHQGLIIDAHCLFEKVMISNHGPSNNHNNKNDNHNDSHHRKFDIRLRRNLIEGRESNKMLSDVLSQWNCMKDHDHGRIILSVDEKMFRKFVFDENDETSNSNDESFHEKWIDRIREELLSLDLSFPIYYVYANRVHQASSTVHVNQQREYVRKMTSDANLFFHLPNPGMFAFVHYGHSLDLSKSLYLTDGKSSLSNLLIPIPYCAFDEFCSIVMRLSKVTDTRQEMEELSRSISSELSRIVKKPNPLLWKMVFEDIEYCSHVKSVLTPSVKRFPLLQELAYDENITDECYFELKISQARSSFTSSRRGDRTKRCHGIILDRKYIQYFLDQEDNFVQNETRNENSGGGRSTATVQTGQKEGAVCSTPSRQNEKDGEVESSFRENTQFISPISKRSKSKEKHDEDEVAVSPPQKHSEASTSSSDNKSEACEQHKIRMTVQEISRKFGIVYFQRGRDYKNNKRISHLRTRTVSSNAFKLYSICEGSRDEPYKQESLFKSGVLLKSICTCPIGEDYGGCKHVCAQILAYLDKENYEKTNVEVDRGRVQLPAPQTIESLDPIDERWCIKAKVLSKTKPKSWVNRSNSGKIATILVQDELVSLYTDDTVNQIKVILFNEAINAFYDMLEERNTYFIAFGNLQYSNPNHNQRCQLRTVTGQVSKYEIQLNEQFSIVRPANQLGFAAEQQQQETAQRGTSNIEEQRQLVREQFESRMASNKNDGVIVLPSLEEDGDLVEIIQAPASQSTNKASKSVTPKKRTVHDLDSELDDDDPLRLLNEIQDLSDDRVEREEQQDRFSNTLSMASSSRGAAQNFGSKSVSPTKRRKTANTLDSTSSSSDQQQRRYSEPVRVDRVLVFDDDSTPKQQNPPHQQQQQQQQRTTPSGNTSETSASHTDDFKTPKKVSLATMLSALRNS